MGRSSDGVVAVVRDHLELLARQTHARLGDVAGVAVTMSSADGRPVTAGASTELARRVDRIQFEIGHGPCLHALRGGGGDYVPDLGGDDRWGEYGPAAAALGARSCVSVPVARHGEVLAVAKVYAAVVDGLTPDQRRLAQELATEAAGTIGLAQTLTAHADELDDRTQAMNTRRLIDVAVGVVMQRASCAPDAAFALLRTQSQHSNTSVVAVAQSIVSGFGGPVDPSAPFDVALD